MDCPLLISFLCQVLLAFVDPDTWAGIRNDATSLTLDPGLKIKICLKNVIIRKANPLIYMTAVFIVHSF